MIALWQIEVNPWRTQETLQKAISKIESSPRWSLIILPEMMFGYMVGDKWLYESFVKDRKALNDDILAALKRSWNYGIWGNIDYDETKKNEDGSMRKYNAVYMAWPEGMLKTVYKTLLPNYGEFDDKRYFTSLKQLALEEWEAYTKKHPFKALKRTAKRILKWKTLFQDLLSEKYAPVEMVIEGVKKRVSALICEDIWNINADYDIDPVVLTLEHQPDIVWVSSTSPAGVMKSWFRRKLLEVQSKGTTLAYVNPIGIQNIGKNILAFDGGSAIYKDGKCIEGTRDYTEDELLSYVEEKEAMQEAYEIIIHSLRKFWEQSGKKKFFIWLSGWVDSALVTSLLVQAIGKENVVALNMPSEFNTDLTKDLARECAEKLGIEYRVYPIQDQVDQVVKDVESQEGKKVSTFDLENIQAKIRWQMLMNVSANEKGLFTCNANKDEMLTGYGTLYGDIAGAIAPIGDLYKYEVWEMSRLVNTKLWAEVIPIKTIEMKPTAELSKEQNPEQWGGDPFDYEFLGKLSRLLTERRKWPEDILQMFLEGNLEKQMGLSRSLSEIFPTKEKCIWEVEKIVTLMTRAYFKRIQAPPVVKLRRAAFGFINRENLGEVEFSRTFQKLKQQILWTVSI